MVFTSAKLNIYKTYMFGVTRFAFQSNSTTNYSFQNDHSVEPTSSWQSQQKLNIVISTGCMCCLRLFRCFQFLCNIPITLWQHLNSFIIKICIFLDWQYGTMDAKFFMSDRTIHFWYVFHYMQPQPLNVLNHVLMRISWLLYFGWFPKWLNPTSVHKSRKEIFNIWWF